MVWYIAIQDHHNPLSQHGIASYMTKVESQSFRFQFKNWGSLCSARELLAQSAVSDANEVKGHWEGQTLAFFWSW